MAEIVPDEGLDYIVGVVLRGTPAPPANTYVGMFTSQTATTVPAAGTVLASAPTGVTEAAPGGYARQAIAAAGWGALGAKTMWAQTGRGTTGPQVTFPQATGAYATAINGFFLATAAAAGVALLYSNFDDSTAIASLGLGDTVRITPTFGLLG